MEFEETIEDINAEKREITLGRIRYSAKTGLITQAIKSFPVGTHVKATVENNEVKSLVKREEPLYG